MSLEHAKALVERMKVDTAFAEKVNTFETIDDRMEYIRQAGFNCTIADINAMSELSDEQLELASAAAANQPCTAKMPCIICAPLCMKNLICTQVGMLDSMFCV